VSDHQYGGRTRPHDPQAAAKVQAYVARLEEVFYRVLLQAQQTQQRCLRRDRSREENSYGSA
jgi:hypothetical protein